MNDETRKKMAESRRAWWAKKKKKKAAWRTMLGALGLVPFVMWNMLGR